MEAVIEAEWRWLPCLALVFLGGWFAARAMWDWRTIASSAHRNLRHMVAFRKAMLAVGLGGVGLGWWLGNPVLFWAGAVIGVEETIETSIALVGLRMEQQMERETGWDRE